MIKAHDLNLYNYFYDAINYFNLIALDFKSIY